MAPRARPYSRAQRCGWLRRAFTLRCSAPFLLGAFLVAWAMQHEGPIEQVSRVLGAAARVTEESSDLLVAALRSAGSMSSATFTWVEDVISASREVSKDAWSGIQLTNVTVKKEAGHFVADSPEVLLAWLETNDARILVTGISGVIEHSQAAVRATLAGVPTVRRTLSDTSPYSSFSFTDLYVTSSNLETTVLVWSHVTANFSVQWANVLWDLLEFNAAGNMSEVSRILTSYVASMPQPSEPPASTVFVKAPSIAASARWRMSIMSRRVRSVVAALLGRAQYGDPSFQLQKEGT